MRRRILPAVIMYLALVSVSAEAETGIWYLQPEHLTSFIFESPSISLDGALVVVPAPQPEEGFFSNVAYVLRWDGTLLSRLTMKGTRPAAMYDFQWSPDGIWLSWVAWIPGQRPWILERKTFPSIRFHHFRELPLMYPEVLT